MDLFLKQISCHISIKPKSVPEVPKLFDTEFIQIPEFIYWELFKKIYSQSKEKIFVDVGAFDGITYSNTYRLFKGNNWYGIYVEPNPISIESLKKNCQPIKSYTLHECAAGSSDHIAKLYLDNEFSCMYSMPNKEFIQIKVKTLNNILSDISKYNLLSLDVEGYEIEVLKNYDISQHSPEVCIVETHDKNPNFNKTITKYCDEYFYKHNYKKYFSNYINTIYIHQSKYDTLTIFDLS